MPKVLLRKFDFRRDLDFVRVAMLESDDRELFEYRINVNSFQAFERWFSEQLSTNYRDFYMICADDMANTVGFVFSYNYRCDDLHCCICTYVAREYQKCGIGGLATVRFIDLLFRSAPLNKVYSTVFGYNTLSINTNIGAGFVHEATMKQFKYCNGVFHDMLVYSMSRQVFYDNYNDLIVQMRDD